MKIRGVTPVPAAPPATTTASPASAAPTVTVAVAPPVVQVAAPPVDPFAGQPAVQPTVPVRQEVLAPASPKLPAAGKRPADLPAYVATAEGVGAGLENAMGEGLQLPMLLLAQPLSPNVAKTQKLKPGDCFLSSDPDVCLIPAGATANFVPFFHYKEWIERAPRDTGRGMLARSKDPRGDLAARWNAQWARRGQPDARPKDQQTSVQEYHVVFAFFEAEPGEKIEPVAIPMSRTKHRKARALLTLAKRRGVSVPLCAGKYALKTVLETNRAGQPYWNFDFNNATPPGHWATQEEYDLGLASYEGLKMEFERLQLAYDELREEPVEDAEVVETKSY